MEANLKKIILGTNAYGSLLSGNVDILEYLVESDKVYVSTIMIGELLTGFISGTKYKENMRELASFLKKESIEIINVTYETAEIFGEIKASLSKLGKMIPINYIWIASHSIETGAKLVTYDKHFHNIQGIRIWENIV